MFVAKIWLGDFREGDGRYVRWTKLALDFSLVTFFGVQKRCSVSKESSIFCFCGRKMRLNEKVRLLGMGGRWIHSSSKQPILLCKEQQHESSKLVYQSLLTAVFKL